jgi:hypothetical protein
MILQTHSMLLAIGTFILLSSLVSPVENYARLRYTCLTPDPTVLDYCSKDLTGPGLPLKTANCKSLCKCTYRGTGTLTVTCQRYGCCSNLDVFTACENHGHCSCQRDAELLQANATMARGVAEGVMDLGGTVRNVGRCH